MVDRLASTQHGKTGRWASRQVGQCLLNTRARLSLGGAPYTGKIDRSIQAEIYSSQMKEYIVQKINLLQTQHLVDWNSLSWHHVRLSLQRRATRLKFVFQWA